MSKVCISVECMEFWTDYSVFWIYLDFHKNLKVLLQPVAKYYLVAALLTNCHTCLYGSVTGS